MSKKDWDEHLAKLAHEKLKLELKDCTFSPNISSGKKSMTSAATSSSGSKKVPSAVFDALSHTPNRDLAAYEQKKIENELKACTFQPNRRVSGGNARGSDVHERLFEDASVRKGRISNESAESIRDGESPALAKLRHQEDRRHASAKKSGGS